MYICIYVYMYICIFPANFPIQPSQLHSAEEESHGTGTVLGDVAELTSAGRGALKYHPALSKNLTRSGDPLE